MAPLAGPIGSFDIGESAIEVSPSYFFPAGQPPSPIGEFDIGNSQIGRCSYFNWQDTVISQYANSPRLLQIIENVFNNLDQTINIEDFFSKMWSIDSAEGYGLDVWGRILGISRTLPVDAGSYFGFAEANDDTLVGFDQEPFYNGPPVTDNYALTDSAYRLLLLAKAAANICDGSIPAINQLLMNLFPFRGKAYVQEGDGLDSNYFGFAETGEDFSQGFDQEPFYTGQAFSSMNMRYVFEFSLTPVELAIVNNSGVLPTPTGVNAIVVINP